MYVLANMPDVLGPNMAGADPDEMPQKVASDQGPRTLFAYRNSYQKWNENKNLHKGNLIALYKSNNFYKSVLRNCLIY